MQFSWNWNEECVWETVEFSNENFKFIIANLSIETSLLSVEYFWAISQHDKTQQFPQSKDQPKPQLNLFYPDCYQILSKFNSIL